MSELITIGINLTIGAIIGYVRGRSDGHRKGIDTVIEELQDCGQYWCGKRLVIIKGVVVKMFGTKAKFGNPLIQPVEPTDAPRPAAPATRPLYPAPSGTTFREMHPHPFSQPVSHE